MVVRKICNWHASRDDEFRSPVVRGMFRTDPAKRSRKRMLNDDEIRAIWRTADGIANGELPATLGLYMFARLVQFILLTGVRRNEGARMLRDEVARGDWLIPAARVKAKREFLLPLSQAAVSVLEGLQVIANDPAGPVFTTNGVVPLAA